MLIYHGNGHSFGRHTTARGHSFGRLMVDASTRPESSSRRFSSCGGGFVGTVAVAWGRYYCRLSNFEKDGTESRATEPRFGHPIARSAGIQQQPNSSIRQENLAKFPGLNH